MKASELLTLFREDLFDTAEPFFWSDAEVYGYMADAYRMFVRLTGGIADFTSDLTRVPIVTGERIGVLDKRIMRIMEAYRASDSSKIEVVNETDLIFKRDNDYGQIRPIYLDTTPGPVRYMVIGSERGKCKWVQVPEVDDVAQLYIYRLPLDTIALDGTSADFDFQEIGEEHHQHLLLWMRRCALLKADADTFNKGKADDFEKKFIDYCNLAKAEWERSRTKVRRVTYGGL